ncbi:hypothetical protein AK812_SmicGene28498 [Symbiodinium microadriaticum]|uniref:Uncharacterized protein n=1 Tax=Symbiodinium microadriaticum TaxID=2951 RepID=A0A1Q9D481_SYMMI|nr:hypothetical protein AK812_SmicGene28498 [Symbiodinium microadriaticum]
MLTTRLETSRKEAGRSDSEETELLATARREPTGMLLTPTGLVQELQFDKAARKNVPNQGFQQADQIINIDEEAVADTDKFLFSVSQNAREDTVVAETQKSQSDVHARTQKASSAEGNWRKQADLRIDAQRDTVRCCLAVWGSPQGSQLASGAPPDNSVSVHLPQTDVHPERCDCKQMVVTPRARQKLTRVVGKAQAERAGGTAAEETNSRCVFHRPSARNPLHVIDYDYAID